MAESKSDLVWDPSQPAIESARQVLPKLAADFFREGRAVVGSSPSAEDLHKLRLTVKRFRYTLELFRSCYGDGLTQRLEALKAMQDHLGAMNDCETTTTLVESMASETEGGEVFVRYLAARGEQERKSFLRHWTRTFDAPGQQSWWVDYLGRPESRSTGRADQHDPRSEPVLKKAAAG